MLGLLRCLPVLALATAAVDAWLVRREMLHRPLDARLYGEAVLLWSCFGLLALLPAWPTARFLGRWAQKDGERAPWAARAVALGAWMVLPVLAHERLDAFTSIGQDVSGLFHVRPWLEVLAVVAVVALAARAATPILARLPARPAAAAIAAAALVLGLFVPGGGQRLAAPAASAPAGAPNLLLLVWDTTRAQNLPPYGYSRPTTPYLARLAEESLVFEESRSVSCFTLSSHLSMLTGVFPSHHGASLTRMTYDPRRTPSVARLLHEAGYRTGGFVGTGVLRANTGMVEGFEVYDDLVDPPVCDTAAWSLVHDLQAVLAKLHPRFARNGRPHWFQDFQRPGREVLERARAWIEADDPRPWFCFINLYDAHWPYLPGPDAHRRFVAPSGYTGEIDGFLFRSDDYHRPPGVAKGSRLGEADRRHLIDLYDGELFDLDWAVQEFLEELDLEAGGTAMLLTSDHGEAFGEAGRYEHDDITEPQVRVPLVLWLPRERGGERPLAARVEGRTSGVDVAATLLGLAGLERPEHLRGIDLSSELPPADRPILVEDRDKLAVEHMGFAYYEGPWKLLRKGRGEGATHHLYDLSRDGVGMYDLSAEHPEVAADLRAKLEAWQAEWGGEEEALAAGGAVVDPALRGLGYTGGSDEPE